MSAKSDKKVFYSIRKHNTKLPWSMSAKSDTSLPGFMHNEMRIFFGSPLKTFPHEIMELIKKLEKIKKNIRTWVVEPKVSKLWCFEKGHTFLLSTGQIFCQKLLYHIVAMIVLKRFRIATHCWAASSSIKTFFVKLTTFSTVQKTEYETKPNNDFESTSKIK